MEIAAFLEMHRRDAVPAKDIPIPENIDLDNDLESFLFSVGVSSFSNGFLRTLNHDDLSPLIPAWKWADAKTFIFLRTAFGGLFYIKALNYYFFDPLYDDHVNLTDDLGFILNIALCDKKSLRSTFLFHIYQEGVALKGIPQKDECFAFVPALKMGGVKSAEHLEIVKLKEHLYFLSLI
jgi:hypothetical protein